MDESLRQLVRLRAGGRCEYCHLRQSVHAMNFEIEHIVPRQHGGKSMSSNLAWACPYCNRRKGTNLTGLDRSRFSPRHYRLFHSRKQQWHVHFIWQRARIVGVTSVGRVSATLLGMNDLPRLNLRESLLREGVVFS